MASQTATLIGQTSGPSSTHGKNKRYPGHESRELYETRYVTMKAMLKCTNVWTVKDADQRLGFEAFKLDGLATIAFHSK